MINILKIKKVWKAIAVGLYSLAFLIYYWSEKDKSPLSTLPFYIALFGTIASIVSIFIPTERVIEFTKNDWKEINPSDFILTIDYKKHGIGTTISTVVYIKKDNGEYEEISCGARHDRDGNVYLSANVLIDGKVKIS
jgi:hypothetical protein